ncbi:MAG: DUF4105 domain-containing protein [Muribaculaceae bacterium]|nr:DUF4105 domain-containing protein [Muribaculaceae bacterium]
MQVSLLTCEPGTDVYELEGHTALRFRDTESNTDYTVNWGLFDFNSPGFIYRFVKGETDYMCGAFPTARFLASYQYEGRRVTEQILNLTPEQVETLYRLVADNLRAENCSYRYKYLTDNCATRPLTLLERAIGHKPEANPDSTTVTTWRNEMRHYHRNYPWYQFGIDLALGSRLDKKITSHDRTFAPIYLRDYLEDSGISGEPVELLPATDFGQPYGPTPWILTPMAAAIFILLITISVIALKKKWPTLYKVYTSLFYTLMALAGAVIVFLVVISEHEATTPNWLLLWLNPLTIIPAVAIWLKKLNRAVFYYQIVNFVCLIVLLFIFAIGIQSPNPSFWPWMLSDIILATNYIWSNRCIANRHRS